MIPGKINVFTLRIILIKEDEKLWIFVTYAVNDLAQVLPLWINLPKFLWPSQFMFNLYLHLHILMNSVFYFFYVLLKYHPFLSDILQMSSSIFK